MIASLMGQETKIGVIRPVRIAPTRFRKWTSQAGKKASISLDDSSSKSSSG
jgi:hypothetical protein